MHFRATTAATASALVAAATLVATPAHASSTITNSGGGFTLTLGSASVVTATQVGDRGIIRITSSEGIAEAPSPYCGGGGTDWTCEGVTSLNVVGSSGADSVTTDLRIPLILDAGDGNDAVTASGTAVVTIHAGPGDDTVVNNSSAASGLFGGTGNDTLHGGTGPDGVKGEEGDDVLSGGVGHDSISGGDGNDILIGDSRDKVPTAADGDDSLYGEAGDDVLMGMGGQDALRGGEGNDTASYAAQYTGQAVAFSFSLTGQRDDGAQGEGDTADSAIENLDVTGSPLASASITMSGAANVVTVDATGPVTITTLGGNDTVRATGSAVSVDAGEGDDTVTTGAGNDLVTGGPGTDTIDVGAGDDAVETVDAAADTLTCGTGVDSARVDGNDDTVTLTQGLTCETLDLVGARVPLTLPKRAKVSRKGVLTLRAKSPLPGAVTLAITAKSSFGTVAKAKVQVKALSKRSVRLRLTKAALSRLRRGAIKATVSVTITQGGSGKLVRKLRLTM